MLYFPQKHLSFFVLMYQKRCQQLGDLPKNKSICFLPNFWEKGDLCIFGQKLLRSQSPQKFGKYFWGRFFPACETNFLRGGQILNNKGSHNSIFRQILCYLLVEKERKPKKMIEIQQQITKEKQKEKRNKREQNTNQ